jgi:hypothetical protein
MLQKKTILAILATICVSIQAPRKKKPKPTQSREVECPEARRFSTPEITPEVKDQIKKIETSSADSNFLFLTEEEITKYEPFVKKQVETFFPLGQDRVFKKGSLSSENRTILTGNQLKNLFSIKKGLGSITRNMNDLMEELLRFENENFKSCLEIIKTKFNKFKPKLNFSTETFRSTDKLHLLFMQLIDFTSALSWINECKQTFSTKDPLLDSGTKSIVSAIFGFFEIIDRELAKASIEKGLSALTFEIITGIPELTASKKPDHRPSLGCVASGGAGGPTPKRIEDFLASESTPIKLRELAKDINAFNTGRFSTSEHFSRPTNMIVLQELDYYPDTEIIAEALKINFISKKTRGLLFSEIKLKTARTLTNLAITIGLKLQEELIAGSAHAEEIFNYYTDLSLKYFSSKENRVFKYQLELLKEKFGTLKEQSFAFLFDALTLSTIDINHIFFLISRSVTPPEWMQSEDTIEDTLCIKKLNAFIAEKQRAYQTALIDEVESIQKRYPKRPTMLKTPRMKPDTVSIPTSRAEGDLAECESLSLFKIAIPNLQFKDLRRLPGWIKYTAKYFIHEASFLNNIPNSEEMFSYKYSNLSPEELLLRFKELCDKYKLFVDEQDSLLAVEPGRISTTRLLTIFSSIKHLVFSRPEIDLRAKIDVWSRSMGIPLDFLDISQIGEWLKSIDNNDYLERLFNSEEEDSYSDNESDSEYDPLAGKFLAGLE